MLFLVLFPFEGALKDRNENPSLFFFFSFGVTSDFFDYFHAQPDVWVAEV